MAEKMGIEKTGLVCSLFMNVRLLSAVGQQGQAVHKHKEAIQMPLKLISCKILYITSWTFMDY